MSKSNCGIYEIKNILTGTCYIGSSSNIRNRKYQHFWSLNNNKHGNTYLQNSYKKYKEKNFSFTLIKKIEKIEDKKLLKEELFKWEDYYITEYKNNSIELYNIREAAESNLGIKFSKEHNEKISIARKGIKLSKESIEKRTKSRENYIPSEETKIKIGKSNKGKIMSIEAKMKISETRKLKGYVPSEYCIQKSIEANKNRIPWNKGLKMTEDFCKKVSESNKGSTPWNKGIPCTEETKRKISETLKKTLDI